MPNLFVYDHYCRHPPTKFSWTKSTRPTSRSSGLPSRTNADKKTLRRELHLLPQRDVVKTRASSPCFRRSDETTADQSTPSEDETTIRRDNKTWVTWTTNFYARRRSSSANVNHYSSTSTALRSLAAAAAGV